LAETGTALAMSRAELDRHAHKTDCVMKKRNALSCAVVL
jgi:hypothetical protein